MFSKIATVSISLLASSSLVAGHAAIIKATGDAGGAGSAIGVDPNTPRDGTNRNPFQQDATRFRGAAADTCGETLGGGANDIAAGTAQVMQLNGATLPQVSAGGSVMMTVHQVNSDGAGPYTCMVDASGTGANWQAATVTTNLPGNDRGRNRDTQMQDLPLTVSMPAGMTCTGTVAGQSNVCMVRCQNPARAGPFGGCVPVQMAGAAGAAPAASAAAGAAPAGKSLYSIISTSLSNLTQLLLPPLVPPLPLPLELPRPLPLVPLLVPQLPPPPPLLPPLLLLTPVLLLVLLVLPQVLLAQLVPLVPLVLSPQPTPVPQLAFNLAQVFNLVLQAPQVLLLVQVLPLALLVPPVLLARLALPVLLLDQLAQLARLVLPALPLAQLPVLLLSLAVPLPASGRLPAPSLPLPTTTRRRSSTSLRATSKRIASIISRTATSLGSYKKYIR
jgi:hypothetical protein